MAIKPIDRYPGRVDPADADYPFGKARDVTSPGDGTGTPWQQDIINDVLGMLQALLSEADVEPSGTPDTAQASQYLGAIRSITDWQNDIKFIGYQIGSPFALASGATLDTSTQFTGQGGVVFNADGTKLYAVAATNSAVYQYTLSTPYDLSTATYDSVSLDVSGEASSPQDLIFNADGTKLYIINSAGGSSAVYQYTLSTPYDLSTATYDSVSLDVSGEMGFARCLVFNGDGSALFAGANGNTNVYEYTLSTPYDLSTATYDSAVNFSAETTNVQDVEFGDAGRVFLLCRFGSGSASHIYRYTLSTPYDLSTATYDGVSISVGTAIPYVGFTMRPDGTKLYTLHDGANELREHYTSRAVRI